MSQRQNFVNNKYVNSHSSSTFDLVDPSTGEIIGQSPNSNEQDVEEAYAAAEAATATWGRTTPAQRHAAMLKIANAMESRRDDLIEAQARNTGQPKYLIASEEMDVGIDQLRFFAGAARMLSGVPSGEYLEGFSSSLRREPIGAVGQITPWNYPFMMAVWKIGPALAAGNTIVLKPSDTTPDSTLLMAEIAAEFLPEGTFNVVLGNAETGAFISSSKVPGLVAITGSVKAGMAVAAAAAKNLTQVHLELGGKAPCVVFDDADLDAAATTLAETGFFNGGQDCTASTRILVQESVHDDFLAKLVEAAKATTYGTPEKDDILYGPLNNINQLERIEGIIERLPAHATIATGGKRADDMPGFFFKPTVVDGLHQDDEAIQNEIFGPVITVQTFSTEEDAVRMSNDVEYGLASSVWTKDHARALRVSRDLDFGCVWINCHIPLVAEMPHGGFKSSGYGKDLSRFGVEEYTRLKHVMSSMG